MDDHTRKLIDVLCDPAFEGEENRLQRHAIRTLRDSHAALEAALEQDAAEVARLRESLTRTDCELIATRARADDKIALRREVESILGVESGQAGDEQFARGVARLRGVIEENARLKRESAEAFAEWLPNVHVVVRSNRDPYQHMTCTIMEALDAFKADAAKEG